MRWTTNAGSGRHAWRWTGGIAAAALAAAVLWAPVADAGWRELGLVIIPMHPSEDAEARRCFTKLRKQIVGEDSGEIVHSRVGPEVLERRLGAEIVANWTDAPHAAFDPLHEWEPRVWRDHEGAKIPGGGYTVDAIVMIDCRPAAKTLDIVSVAPAGSSVMRTRLSQREIGRDLRSLVARLVIHHAWADFSP
jgi:hypothetical protein